ncbi:S ribonuclease [Pyrus ussuriensis x Pyrus communis]|uniref:S ribonuclease n=1 Tax=Pyrus ussuriensis x Pyrus communis TaxID=2448454 RepID=A0A5N5G3T5_9ROSA|nr:S ribonuclease [Pyrus ussuriensis x Pyrus communis]
MPAHESEPPIVVCTTGLGANKYAQVLQSCEGCANNHGSPTSRNHLMWSVQQGCAPNLNPR